MSGIFLVVYLVSRVQRPPLEGSEAFSLLKGMQASATALPRDADIFGSGGLSYEVL